ncbi:MAG: sugar phosphate nucleotidyltransferase [Vulcanimicrobiota bacterium]
MKAVLMAGGEGTRLRPLTANRPKPLVSLANKPVMEYIIELLKKHGITQIIITLHYLADEIVSYFGDGSDWGVQLMYSVEEEPLGTAGAVKMVSEYLDDTFMIISGDALTDFDLSKAIEYHKEKKAVATLTLTRVDNPLEYGVVITDEDGSIRRFLEKPSWGEVFSDTVNTGIYILEPEVFDYMEKNKKYDWSKDIFPQLLERERPMFGHIATGYWCDIGNLQQYRQAHIDLIQGRVDAEPPGKNIGRKIWLGEGSEIHPEANIQGPCVIGKNCRIKAGVNIDEFTVIGDNCIVEEEANIHRCIMWNNVYVGKKTRMVGSIICRHNTIKNNVVINEGVVLGDKVYIGSGAVVQPQVKVWPDKNIEAGATVNMSLIWGVKWPGSLFGVDGISGLANIELTPELALKLGAAFGAYLAKNSSATTSRDSNPAVRMINRAIICGMTSVGVNIHDLRVLPSPISRYAIKNTGAKGGIHTRIDPTDPRSILLEFFDDRGINISKAVERKLENIFFREDFRRTPMEEVGTIDFPSRSIDQYNEGYINNLDTDAIRKANFKVVINYGFGNATLVLPYLLGKMGCEMIAINAYLEHNKAREAMENVEVGLKNLSDIVTTLNADLGVRLDVDSEKIIIADDKGNIISDDKLLALYAYLTLKHTPNSIVAVPVTAPSIIEAIAHRFNGKVIRTKTDGRSLMHTASLGEKRIAFAGNSNGKFIFPQFQTAFDAMFAFAKMMEMLALEGKKLSEFLNEIPDFHVATTSVECRWQQKGKIMRRMIEMHKDKPMEVVEGLKIFYDQAWTLMLPDPAAPVFHLYAEAGTDKEARKYLEKLVASVEELKEETPVNLDLESPEKKPVAENVEEPRDERGGYLSVERAFHFWIPGKYLGIRARNFKEFVDAIHYIEPASMQFHMSKGDFANWLEYELDYPKRAQKIRALRDQDIQGEELREALLKILAQ